MTLQPGTRLGTYEILGPLGAGGMGEVYRARDTRLDREVAIKVLPEGFAADPARLARLEREARTVAGLNHPNIVTLYSVEDEDETRFLTMELVEGQTLTAFVTPAGMPLPKLLELAIPLTDALVTAHEKGVIHRDLKPGNVMVTREGRVKVLDFGLAKMMSADGPVDQGGSLAVTVESPISGEGHVVGTVPYMAPEQLRGETVDARSDLFSLGIILYELATGQRPFTGETSIDVSHAILHSAPEPPSRVRADIPDDLARMITRCLEKNPRDRGQSAIDVNNELRRLRKALDRGEPAKVSDKVASIAVLPFVNRSGSADDEYFSDGLADELLNVLSKIKGLRVTARSSSFHFKGTSTPAAEIGRTLNVTTLLEGSVRKAGNRIRVSVQLVQVSDSSHIWSETYDRTLEDIFAVQDDIAQSVVKELRTTLLGQAPDSDASGKAKAEVAQAARGRGTDPEAHRLLLLARHLIDRATREETAKAMAYLNESIARDPEYALAWAELGAAHMREGDLGWAPAAEAYGRAKEAVERALVLNPDLAEGHSYMGQVRMLYGRDFRGAEASYARALELSPGSAAVLFGLGELMGDLGKPEKAIDVFQRALEQDPLNATGYTRLGNSLHEAGRFAEAESAFHKSLELAPHRTPTRGTLALTLLALGRGNEALEEARREPENWARLWALAIVHHRLGHAAESDAALQELIEKRATDSAYQIAEVYGARAETENAFKWLERAYVQYDGGLVEMKANDCLRSLHGDPRWSPFLKKMGLDG